MNKKSAVTILTTQSASNSSVKSLNINNDTNESELISNIKNSLFFRAYNLFLWLFIVIAGILVFFLIVEIYSRKAIYTGRAYNFEQNQLDIENKEAATQKVDIQSMWPKTDFSKSQINLDTIYSAGPSRDAIPAIKNPKFVLANSINKIDLADSDKGVFVQIGNISKFYPLNILVWHEVVNDNIGASPFAVTYCPLTGTTLVFSRNSNDTPSGMMTFGVSGLLYKSNLVLYDVETESLWSQVERTSIVGANVASKLEALSFQLMTFSQAQKRAPSLMVLTTDTGYVRDYKNNPYQSYEISDEVYSEFGLSYDQPDYPAKKSIISFENQGIKYGLLADDLVLGKSVNFIDANGNTLVVRNEEGFIDISFNGQNIDDFSFEYWFSWIKSAESTKLFKLKA